MLLFIMPNQTAHGVYCDYTIEPVRQLLQSRNVFAVIDPNNQSTTIEAWYSASPVESGLDNGCHWSENEDLLSVTRQTDEEVSKDLRQASSNCYQQLLRFVTKRGHSHIVRA